jgi:GTP-binding protein
LTNRKKLARISSEPGKTRVINFYDIENKIYFVDLPGYGYAKVSKSEKEKWANMIESYLKTREQLCAVVLLVDIRHDPTKDDIQMYEWLKYFKHNIIVACTKSDKISKLQVKKNLQNIKNILKLGQDDIIIPFSSETKSGKEELWSVLDNLYEDIEVI